MPKSYADLLREARAEIKEVTPQEVAALDPGAATLVDVREASEWEQGHVPSANHVSKSYIEQQIEGVAPDRDHPPVAHREGLFKRARGDHGAQRSPEQDEVGGGGRFVRHRGSLPDGAVRCSPSVPCDGAPRFRRAATIR